MKKIILSFMTCTLLATTSNAQRVCGSHEHQLEMMQQDPQYAANRAAIEAHTAAYSATQHNQVRVVKTIPVVVHVLYNTAAQNISDAQIQSQLTVLNNDFRKLNTDWTSTPTVFQGLVADCEINFCLAQRDPNGNATNGIVRKSTTTTAFSTNDAIKKTAQGGDDAWNTASYLNLWVGNISGGILGYAQFPGGAALTDGVVINYTAFGNMGTAAAPYNLGRTATHEVGHWLNLYHIWGDDGTACTGSDLVGDTPNQGSENYGCPAFPHVSCSNGPNGDMFMNYMDYTDDACMFMFSAGQKARMDALFATGGARASLLNSLGCQAPNPVACGTVSGLSATAITNTSATINWTAVSGATSYNVQYKLATATTWTSATSTSTTYALSGLTAGATYNYQIQSVCTAGNGTYSASASFTTTGGATPTCSSTYESNNTAATATTIAINTSIKSQIQTSTDVDWYKITTTAAAPKVKLTLSTLPADYDVKLYKSNGTTLIATSQNGGTTSETITYNTPTAAATYLIRVYGYSGATSTTACYTLTTQTSATNLKLDVLQSGVTKDAIQIIPNPVSTKANIHFYATQNKNAIVNVYNTLGQKITSTTQVTLEGENTMYIDLQNQANGLYVLELIIDGESTIQKFTISK